VLVGEAASAGQFRKVERIVAKRDDLLDALFERTFDRLSPAARRVFLTLCSWRSLIPQLALDAALVRPAQAERIDAVEALEELRRVSFIDEYISAADDSLFVSVPLVASVFGKRKLSASADRIDVQSDVRFLQKFGAMQSSDVQHGIQPRIQRFFDTLSDELSKDRIDLEKEKSVLELLNIT
jgi:hypothetical protein